MAYDGKILGRVRQAIAEDKARNEAEAERRRTQLFAAVPELRDIEVRITRLMTGVVNSALRSGEDAGRAVAAARGECQALLARRGELLRAHGYEEDYLDELYTCPDCRDSGYIMGRPCACLDARYKLEAARELSSMLDTRGQSFESFKLEKYSDVYDPELKKSPREAMRAVFELCRDYACSFGGDSPSLLFRGGTGLGKTFLSASIAQVVSSRGFSVVYDTAVSVFDAFESQKFDRGGERSEETDSKIKRYLGCELLILDDLGTEMTTSFTASALYRIINTRLLNGVQTIISTNLGTEEMQRRYTSQIVSRLEGGYMRLNFVGSDIRRSRPL